MVSGAVPGSVGSAAVDQETVRSQRQAVRQEVRIIEPFRAGVAALIDSSANLSEGRLASNLREIPEFRGDVIFS